MKEKKLGMEKYKLCNTTLEHFFKNTYSNEHLNETIKKSFHEKEQWIKKIEQCVNEKEKLTIRFENLPENCKQVNLIYIVP